MSNYVDNVAMIEHHNRLMAEIERLKKDREWWADRWRDAHRRMRDLENPDFEMFVVILDRFLAHYPADTIVCSDKPEADRGAQFTAALRAAREILND